MAVYTEVNDEDLTDFVAQYDIGGVLACKGIAEGVENTNYILRTEKGAYILTLYEKRVNRADLPFFMELMEHLSKSGVTCPTPIRRPLRAARIPDCSTRGADRHRLVRGCNRSSAMPGPASGC